MNEELYKELLARGYWIDFDIIIPDGIRNLYNKIWGNLDTNNKSDDNKCVIITCYDPNCDLKIKL